MSLAWIALILSGVLEAIWATALSASNGLRKLWPTVTFLLAFSVSMLGLSFAMSEIPVGTAYAVWVGIGAVLTATWAIASRAEQATVLRVILLLCLIGCVVGLKAVS